MKYNTTRKNETTTILNNVVNFKAIMLYKRSQTQNSVCHYLYKVQRQALVIDVDRSQDDTLDSWVLTRRV